MYQAGFRQHIQRNPGGFAIARGRFQPPQKPLGKQLRINDFIRSPQVRLIGDSDEQIGIVDLVEAKRRAREAGLDLVEVAPMSQPPVCRIMDYGKWKYSQKKKEQKARSHAKQSELKEVRLRPKTDDHDLDIKLRKARDFLGGGDKVQFTMLFKGREMAHREIGLKIMQTIRDGLADASKVEAEPRQMGKRMTMVLAPDRKPKAPGAPAVPGAAPAPGAPGTPAAPARPGIMPPAPGAVGTRPSPAAAAPNAATARPATPATPPPGAPQPGAGPVAQRPAPGTPQPAGVPNR